jgi:hypothetical protein
MANTTISALPSATTPLNGTEVVPIVQSGVTSKVAVSDIAVSGGVKSFQTSLSGLTPSAATAGVVTLAGTLGTPNGGTGLGGATPFTANGVVYANSTSALTTGSALIFNGTNLGLGVTPSAWNTAGSGRAIQFLNSTNLAVARASALASWYGAIGLMNDCYYGTDNNFKYYSGQAPALYTINNGTHLWQYAASGTAGNTIAFVDGMSLDASGMLSVNGPIANVGGTSSTSYSGTSTIRNASASSAAPGTHGSSLVFAQSWTSGTPTSTVATGQITGVKINSDGTFGGGLAFWTSNGSGTDLLERMRIDVSGNLGIGTTSASASAILDAQSTTKGVRMPNMTTTQKNAISSPAAGLMVFDTTLAKLCVYSGSAWQTITSV